MVTHILIAAAVTAVFVGVVVDQPVAATAHGPSLCLMDDPEC